jgi:hypothetical protein
MCFPTGGRTSKDIISWLEKKGGALPPKEITVLEKPNMAKALAESAKQSSNSAPVIVFVGLFKNKDGEEAQNFLKLARSDDLEDAAEFVLGHTDEIFEVFGAKGRDNVIVVLKPFDEQEEKHEKDFREIKVEAWMKRNLLPHLAVANKYRKI